MIEARKVRVALGDSPQQDRYVSLTSARILATDVFVVGVVDGTGRLADHTTLLTTPVHERARRHANRLVQRLGRVEQEEHYSDHLPREVVIRTGYGLQKRPRPGNRRKTPTSVNPVVVAPRGGFAVRWSVGDGRKPRSRRFDTEREAEQFHQQLIQQLEETNNR